MVKGQPRPVVEVTDRLLTYLLTYVPYELGTQYTVGAIAADNSIAMFCSKHGRHRDICTHKWELHDVKGIILRNWSHITVPYKAINTSINSATLLFNRKVSRYPDNTASNRRARCDELLASVTKESCVPFITWMST